MAQGVVKWFSNESDCGFVSPDDEARTSTCAGGIR